jgi:hypothetical protein
MWRQETQGEFFLLFNACLNYNFLHVGWPEKSKNPEVKKEKEPTEDGEAGY